MARPRRGGRRTGNKRCGPGSRLPTTGPDNSTVNPVDTSSSSSSSTTVALADRMTRTSLKVLSTNHTWRFRSLVSHHAEAETRPCSTSPSEDRRHRVRTRSELTGADDNDDDHDASHSQKAAMDHSESPVHVTHDCTVQSVHQPLGKRPRLMATQSSHLIATLPSSSSLILQNDADHNHEDGDAKVRARCKPPSGWACPGDEEPLSFCSDEGCLSAEQQGANYPVEGVNITPPISLQLPIPYSGPLCSVQVQQYPNEDAKLAANLGSEQSIRGLPAPQVFELSSKECPERKGGIAGLWRSIGWEVELHYDSESAKVWGRWGPVQALTARLDGNRLVDGMLELGSIRLSDAVVDLDAGTISWGTGEKWTRLTSK